MERRPLRWSSIRYALGWVFCSVIGVAAAQSLSLDPNMQLQNTSHASPRRPIALSINHRRLPAQDAFIVRGIAYIDATDAVGILGGIFIYRSPQGCEISLQEHRYILTNGSTSTMLDDKSSALPAPPFFEGTHTYIPVRTLARLAQAKVHYIHGQLDIEQHAVAISAPQSSSSLLKLSVMTTIVGSNLAITTSAVNTSASPLALSFPSSARMSYIAARNGVVLWRSTSNVRALETLQRLYFDGQETKTFTTYWPGFGAAGVGPIRIEARLLTTPPVDAPVVVVDGVAPAPDTTPRPTSSPSPKAAFRFTWQKA